MDVLSCNGAWFFSAEGIAAYNSRKSLEEKTLFLYAFLSKTLHDSYCKDATCFHFALFLADAVSGADLPYSTYPALIDPNKNPFLAFLVNWGKHPGKRIIYYGFMSILHELADPMMKNSWIYDKALMESDALGSKLIELEHNFYDEMPNSLINPLALDIAEPLKSVQLKIMWFFGHK